MTMNELIIADFFLGMMVGGAIMWGIDWQYLKRREKAHDEHVDAILGQYKRHARSLERGRDSLIEERDAYRAKVRAAIDALGEKH